MGGLALNDTRVLGTLIGAEDAYLFFLLDSDNNGTANDLVVYNIDSGVFDPNQVMLDYTFKFDNYSASDTNGAENFVLNQEGDNLMSGRTLEDLVKGNIIGSDGVTPIQYLGIGAYNQIYAVDGNFSVVPEPSSAVLCSVLGSLLLLRRKARN